MSLSQALSAAQSIFTNTGTQSAVTAKNISNAQNPDYTKRSAVIVTGGGGAIIGEMQRATSAPLLRQTIDSTAISSGQRTLLNGLEDIKSLMGGNDNETAPATFLAAFRDDLDAYAAKANDSGLGTAVVSSAQDLVTGLNTASNSLQALRKEADDNIKQNVSDLNSLLTQFGTVNNQIKIGSATGADVNDALDQRDALVKQISEIVGVTSSVRDGNDMVLYTTDGTTLFETVPRTVTFAPTSAFSASTVGGQVYIDGTAVKAGQTGDTSAKGSIAAYLQLRDDIAPTFQDQLDEIARGLITTFAEENQTTPADPAKTGLFTYTNTLGVQQDDVPTAGTVDQGLASRIKLNPAVVPPAGTPNLIRDGGINGTDYVVNTEGGSSFGDLIDKYNQALEAPMTFDTQTEIADSPDLMSFASDSIGWLEEIRSTATTADETKYAMLTRSVEAYSSDTGVSLDEELSLLLDIEQSYKAGAKLMSTVDEMMKSLLDIAS